MTIYYGHIFSPLLGLFVNIIVQVSRYRLVRKTGLLTSVFVGFFFGFVVVFIVEMMHFATANLSLFNIFGYLLHNFIAYTGFGYCYFHFINLGETARRVRILRELWEAQTGLSMNELIQRYNASVIIDIRLRRMIQNKQIIERDSKFYIRKPIMLSMAKIVLFMKQILLGKKMAYKPMSK